MPLVSVATLQALIQAGALAAVRHPDGSLGIPAYFPAAWLAELETLTGDQGAGRLLRGSGATLVPAPLNELRDVDTVEALERLSAELNP